MRIVAIGCSKTKLVEPSPKRGNQMTPTELYGGQLFAKRVRYAELAGLPWCVLSAQYGVWFPAIAHQPYDLAMSDLSPAERAIWHAHAAYRLLHELWEPWEQDETQAVLAPSELTVEIHAGKDYAHPLAEILQSLGVNVEVPCEGMAIGKQLQHYTEAAA